MPLPKPRSFEPNGEISAMVSVEGEAVPLVARIRPAAANGAVEKWLVQVGGWRKVVGCRGFSRGHKHRLQRPVHFQDAALFQNSSTQRC